MRGRERGGASKHVIFVFAILNYREVIDNPSYVNGDMAVFACIVCGDCNIDTIGRCVIDMESFDVKRDRIVNPYARRHVNFIADYLFERQAWVGRNTLSNYSIRN